MNKKVRLQCERIIFFLTNTLCWKFVAWVRNVCCGLTMEVTFTVRQWNITFDNYNLLFYLCRRLLDYNILYADPCFKSVRISFKLTNSSDTHSRERRKKSIELVSREISYAWHWNLAFNSIQSYINRLFDGIISTTQSLQGRIWHFGSPPLPPLVIKYHDYWIYLNIL